MSTKFDSKRLDKVRRSKKDNPRGSCVINHSAINGDCRIVAGYLNQRTRRDLFRLAGYQVGDNTQRPVTLVEWLHAYSRNRKEFIQAKVWPSIYTRQITFLLEHPHFKNYLKDYFHDKSTPFPLPKTPPRTLNQKVEIFFATPKGAFDRWSHMNALFAAFQVLLLLPPNILTGALREDLRDHPGLWGFHHEDWMRAVALVRFYVRHVHGRKIGADQPSMPVDFYTLEEEEEAAASGKGGKAAAPSKQQPDDGHEDHERSGGTSTPCTQATPREPEDPVQDQVAERLDSERDGLSLEKVAKTLVFLGTVWILLLLFGGRNEEL
ncbi:hypothetical protein IWZ00DRAFT_541137 [Phyllosticta capitalensis]|uniref:uncharacterized protein n=1 Tax=Phyllosticta capitalensis TaxID=121624 RepID=UPI00312F8436